MINDNELTNIAKSIVVKNLRIWKLKHFIWDAYKRCAELSAFIGSNLIFLKLQKCIQLNHCNNFRSGNVNIYLCIKNGAIIELTRIAKWPDNKEYCGSNPNSLPDRIKYDAPINI